jgi:nucleoside 2-deoxyribosyltransferase
MITVYLAGKMTGLTYQQMTEWRYIAKHHLSAHGIVSLDPATQPLNGGTWTPREVVDSNKYQIRHSDVVLAELNYDNVSIGTIGELVYAREHNKPVIAWGKASIIEHPWVQEHTTKIFGTLAEAVDYLVGNYHYRK